MLGGGGILKDEGQAVPRQLLLTALPARLAGRQVRLLAVGVGPLYTRRGRWMVAEAARLPQVRTVRDAASQRALNQLGVREVEVGADPLFSLPLILPARACPASGPSSSASGPGLTRRASPRLAYLEWHGFADAAEQVHEAFADGRLRSTPDELASWRAHHARAPHPFICGPEVWGPGRTTPGPGPG